MTLAGGDGTLVRGGASPADLLQLLNNPALLTSRAAEAQAVYDKAAKAAEVLGGIDAITALRAEAQVERDNAVQLTARAQYEADSLTARTRQQASEMISSAEMRVTELRQTIAELTDTLRETRQQVQAAQTDLTVAKGEAIRVQEAAASTANNLLNEAQEKLDSASRELADVTVLRESWARKINAITLIIAEA